MLRIYTQRRRTVCLPDRIVSSNDFCKTKIQNLGVAALGHKNVRRLNVTMNNALGVRRIQSIGDLNSNAQQLIQLHRPTRDCVLQGHAVQILHGDKGFSVLLANLVNREMPGWFKAEAARASRLNR